MVLKVRLVGDDFGRQMRWDECPFNGVTNHGGVRRWGAGSKAWSVSYPNPTTGRDGHSRLNIGRRSSDGRSVEPAADGQTSLLFCQYLCHLQDGQTRTRTHTSLEHEIKTKIVKKKKIPQGSASKTLVVLFRFSHKQRTIQELQQFLEKFGVTTEKNQLSPPQGLN